MKEIILDVKFHVILSVFFWSFAFASKSNRELLNLNSLQIIRKFGYPAESHIVKTDDGYLLETHRIPHGKDPSSDSSSPRRAVFIHHGFLGSSADFLMKGTEHALPFLLSDLGFDVWLGNARGNSYSRRHAELSPNGKRFWNYTWHETGIYDNPAQIDYILNKTNQKKLIYIGYSMGTTTFFVTTSTRPEYNEKIEAAFFMAVNAYYKHLRSPLIRSLAPVIELINDILLETSSGELLAKNSVVSSGMKSLCNNSKNGALFCRKVIFLIFGHDPEFRTDSVPTILNYYPQGYSVKTLDHYSQLFKSGKFRAYDYGKTRNMQQYGTPFPPDYNLKAVTVPMYVYEGKNDFLSVLEDVAILSKELSSLRRVRVVDDPRFSHLDFLISHDVKKLVYDPLINDLMSHLNYSIIV